MKIGFYNDLIDSFDDKYSTAQPSTIVLYTAGTFAATYIAARIFQTDWRHLPKTIKGWSFKQVRGIPFIRAIVENEIAKDMKLMQEDVFKELDTKHLKFYLPEEGISKELLLKEAKDKLKNEFKVAQEGKLSGTVYTQISKELLEFVGQIYSLSAYANCLHTGDFPATQACEIAVVQMLKNVYSRTTDFPAFGRVTSGGTESNISAMYAYFQYARSLGIKKPVILAPSTIHASIRTKAVLDPCIPQELREMFGSIVEIDVTPEGKMDLNDFRKKTYSIQR